MGDILIPHWVVREGLVASPMASRTRFQFDSEALRSEFDERGRLALWHDLLVATVCQMEMSYLQDQPFNVNFTAARFGAVGVNRFEGTTSVTHRASRHVAADTNGNFYLRFNVAPTPCYFEQRARQMNVGPGEAVFLTLGERGRFISASGTATASVVIPRQRLLDLVPDAEDRIATPLDPKGEALCYLRRYLHIVVAPGADDERQTSDPLDEHIGTTLLDLATLVLRAEGEAAELASVRGLRAARLQAILAGIQAGAADPEFKIGVLARRLGLSPRYIAKLLHDAGTSFSARLIERRLERARRMLAEPHSRHLRVSDIAYACGFSDVSYFNRCFRRRFGMSPSECR